MVRLVTTNTLDVLVEGRVEASSGEVGLGELVKGLAVEGILEVLEGQSVVEDISYKYIVS